MDHFILPWVDRTEDTALKLLISFSHVLFFSVAKAMARKTFFKSQNLGASRKSTKQLQMPEANSKRIIKMQNKSFQGRSPLCALVLFNNKKRQELVLCCRSSRAFCSLTVGTIRAAARKKGSAGTGQKETIRKKPANVLFLKEENKNNTFGKINEGLIICQSV